MRGEQDRRALAVQQLNGGLQKLAAGYGVQAAGGFVQQQQLGAVAHRAQQCHLARLALAQAVDPGGWRKPEAVQKLAFQRVVPPAEEISVKCDQFRDGGSRRQHLLLGNETDAPLDRDRVVEGRDAEDAHRAAVRREQAHGDVDERGLARAVAAQQADHLAFGHRETDAVEDRHAFLKGSGDVQEFENRGHTLSFSSRAPPVSSRLALLRSSTSSEKRRPAR